MRWRLILACLCLALLVAGCGSSSGGSSTSGTAAEKHPSGGGATASASSATRTERIQRSASAEGRARGSSAPPAAGVCSEASGPVVTVRLLPDVPSPRCVTARPSQRLRVVNETQRAGATPRVAHLRFAGFTASIAPGHAALLDEPLGSFLAPGTFEVQVAPAPGPVALRLLGAGG